MSIYQTAVKRPVTTILIFLGIAIFGLFSLSRLSIDLLPDIETNAIMVMTSYGGASAEDIETNITRPLENTLNSVTDLKHVTSKSREGISVITLEFEYGTDIDVATNDVRFIDSSDFDAHEIRVAIHDGFTLDDPKRPRNYSPQQYMRSEEEMCELFADIPEALANTVEIAKRCNVTVRLGEYFLPQFPTGDMSTEDYLV